MRLRQPDAGQQDGGGEASHQSRREDKDGRAGQHTDKEVVQEQRLREGDEPGGQRDRRGNHTQLPGRPRARETRKGERRCLLYTVWACT